VLATAGDFQGLSSEESVDPLMRRSCVAELHGLEQRIGRSSPCYTYRSGPQGISYKLVSEGTIEERILRLQAGKRFLAEGLWQDPEQLAANLDRDTLLALLD